MNGLEDKNAWLLADERYWIADHPKLDEAWDVAGAFAYYLGFLCEVNDERQRDSGDSGGAQ